MKTARFLFLVMIAAVLLQGTSLASHASPASQQTPSQRGQQSAGDEQKNGEVRHEKGQVGAEEAGERAKLPAGVSRSAERRARTSYSKPLSSHQQHPAKTPAACNPRTAMPENGMGFQLTGSTTSSGGPGKTVNHRSTPVPPATGAVNGQQFKNARDPGAHLASSGGPLTATRGTAAISGTNIKRKP